MAEKHIAQCYCGAVEIEMRGDPLEMGYCHCENCRRYSAAPVSAFTLWKKEAVNVTKGEEFLGRFKSSDLSERGYCTRCGGHIIVEHPTLGLMDVRIGALRKFRFKPKVHLNYAETILPMKDGLLKLKDFPAEIGGSGQSMPEERFNYAEYGPAWSRRIDGDLRGPQVSCAGAHESNDSSHEGRV